MNKKMHFVKGCGRGDTTTNPYMVTCGLCQVKGDYIKAKEEADAVRKALFESQVPRTFMEPWNGKGNITCRDCGEDKFRHGDRTCYGHYDNFHCANCGHVESRLTETGMSF